MTPLLRRRLWENRIGSPRRKTKQRFTETMGVSAGWERSYQPGGQVPGSTGHQAASKGLPRLEQL